MKKKLYIMVLLLVMVSLTGCSSKTLTCTKTSDESIYNLKEKITTKYGMFGVKNININMEMTLKDNSFINASVLEKTLDETYKELKENGAKVNISSKDNKVLVDINFDLKKMDNDKLKEIDLYNVNESYEDAKKSFKKLGYTCK